MRDLSDRHESTRQLARWFEYGHLTGAAAITSARFHDLAADLIETLPDGPELTVALRKLLEAKDAAVRQTIAGAVADF